MVETIKAISNIHSVSGNESSIRKYILENIVADEIDVDTMGNIIAFKKGASDCEKKIAVITNIDECGMIVTDITDDGYVKFDTVGSVELRSIISKPVVISEKIPGIIGMKAIHLQEKGERENIKKAKELYIDIGAKNKKEAAKLVKKGEYISFITEFADFDRCIKGKALDRLGVYALMQSMNTSPVYDTYFIFTVQKEVGMRGAMIVANRINPDTIIVLDSVGATDVYGIRKEEKLIYLDEGPVVSYSCVNAISDRTISETIITLAQKNNIKIQKAAAVREKSDAGEVMLSNSGIKLANIKIPVRYSNTPVQIASKRDIKDTTNLLRLILKTQEI